MLAQTVHQKYKLLVVQLSYFFLINGDRCDPMCNGRQKTYRISCYYRHPPRVSSDKKKKTPAGGLYRFPAKARIRLSESEMTSKSSRGH